MNPEETRPKIGERIGKGYFSEVFIATEPVHGQVAVKILKRHEDETDQEWLERKNAVLQEGQRLAAADHDNIVRVHYVYAENGEPHLVMEHCEGGCVLKDYEKGPLRLDGARDLFSQIALGLEAVHNRGMLHRDIKPGNLLRGRYGRAKLGDFGLVTNDLSLGYAEKAGYTDHLAKEAHETGLTSVRTDMWALGMTLFRVLSGREWYESNLPNGPVAYEVVRGGFAQRLKWLPHIPKQWRSFIRRALHDDPERRIQNARQFINLLSGLPTPAWECEVGLDLVRWRLPRDGRELRVEWSRKTGEWVATSANIVQGTTRTLKKAKGASSLHAFFSAHS